MKNMRIQKRLITSFLIVAILLSVSGIVGAISSYVVGKEYSKALVEYGFTQGDIGKLMSDFADIRSDTRAIIAYDEQELIDQISSDFVRHKQGVIDKMEIVKAGLVTPEGEEIFKKLETSMNKYMEIEDEVQRLAKEGKRLEAEELASAEMSPAYIEAYYLMEDILNIKTNNGNELADTLGVVVVAVVALIIVLVLVGVVIAIKLGVNTAKGIAEPLKALADRFETFAEGDVHSSFPTYNGADEVGDMIKSGDKLGGMLQSIIDDLGQALTGMAAGDWTVGSKHPEKFVGDLKPVFDGMSTTILKMNEALHNITDVSEQVSIGASGLAEAAQSLAEGATDQAGAVEELQATIANITEAVNHTAEKTKESYDQAQEYSEKADASRGEMEKLMEVMGRINETSQQIGNIISEIEDIASQTNLLSLNASIEAARAGEAGKGFAVVADQIGKLADQSGKSAVDTRRLIEGILQEIESGNNVAEHAAGSIAEVVEGVNQIAGTVSSLAQVSGEQAESMGQVEIGINQISEIVQSNSAAAEELSATSEEMLAQAETMTNLEKQFTLKEH